MRVVPGAAVAACLIAGTAAAAPAVKCPVIPARGAAVIATLSLERPMTRRDTMLTVVVCVRATSAHMRIGSLHGEFRYDTLAARFLGLERLAGAAQMENPERGRIRFAAAAPSGTARSGAVLRVRLRPLRAGRVPFVNLNMLEVNSDSGVALISRTRTRGLPESPARPIGSTRDSEERDGERASMPALTDLVPGTVTRRGDGAALFVEIRGRGFSPDRNTVLFGSIPITDVRSTASGTVIRFTVPETAAPDGREAPPMDVPPGSYPIRVRTASGTSNALLLTLTGPR